MSTTKRDTTYADIQRRKQERREKSEANRRAQFAGRIHDQRPAAQSKRLRRQVRNLRNQEERND